MFVSQLGPRIGKPQHFISSERREPRLLNKESNIEELVHALDSHSHSARLEAAIKLSEIDNPQIIDLLMDLVINGSNISRCYAALILGNKGDTRAIKPLTLALQSNDPQLYQYSASALSHLLLSREANLQDISDAISKLKEGLENEEEDIDKAAAIVLGELGKEEALEPLLDYMTGRDDDMRSCARNLLVNFRDDKTTKLLVDILQSEKESPEAKMGAIWVLGEIADRKLIDQYSLEDLLIKYFTDEKENKCIRLYSAEALGKMWSKKAVDPLIESLKLKDQAFSRFGIQALGRIKDPRTVEYMEKLLIGNDPEFSIDSEDRYEVAWYAACALSNMPSSEAVRSLYRALLSEEEIIKLYALETLNNINLPRAFNIDPVIACLDHERDQIKTEAIKLLGKIGNREAAIHLIKFLNDDTPEMRALAASSLGAIGNPNSIQPLVECLNADRNVQVCFSVIFALGKMQDTSISTHLVNSLFKNDNPIIRAQITRVLTKRLGKNIVPLLLAGVCCDDKLISSRARQAMDDVNISLLVNGLVECTGEPFPPKMREKARLLLGTRG